MKSAKYAHKATKKVNTISFVKSVDTSEAVCYTHDCNT